MNGQEQSMKPGFNKPFCNQDELKKSLIQKNFIESTIDTNLFKEINYTELVSPYCCFFVNFKNGNLKNYSKNLDFSSIVEWSRLDLVLSTVLCTYIGFFERKLRSFVINNLCSLMKQTGDNNCVNHSCFNEYLDKSNDSLKPYNCLLSRQELSTLYSNNNSYSTNIEENLERLVNAIKDVFDVTNKKGSLIRYHYIEKYKQIPAYIALTELSLGEMITLFSVLPKDIQANFWETEKGKKQSEARNEKYLSSQLRLLKDILKIRNTVNHYKPVIPLMVNFINNNNAGKISELFKYLKKNYQNSKTNISTHISSAKPILPNIYNPSFHNIKNKLNVFIDSF